MKMFLKLQLPLKVQLQLEMKVEMQLAYFASVCIPLGCIWMHLHPLA